MATTVMLKYTKQTKTSLLQSIQVTHEQSAPVPGRQRILCYTVSYLYAHSASLCYTLTSLHPIFDFIVFHILIE